MVIPSSQLETWTSYQTAAISGARDTHQHIRDNLKREDSRLNYRDIVFDTLLQGSYANQTIIRSSSDVDILVRMTDPFSADMDKLSDDEVDQMHQPRHYTVRDDYPYSDFKADVRDELKEIYGLTAVTQGSKAIEVDSPSLSLEADIVPCQEYRFYNQYTGYDNPRDYIEGIVFWTEDGTRIRNYPEQHMENATAKHQHTNNRYKPTVRMFKNARNRLVEGGYIASKDIAPSYFVECLLWNVNNSNVDIYDLQDRYVAVVEQIQADDFSGYRHQHNLLDLFGAGATEWSIRHAQQFVTGLIEMWNNW